MNTELDKTNGNEPNQDSLIMIGKQGMILKTLSDMWRAAEYVTAAKMCNSTLDSPHKIVLAAQRGLEVGLTFMQSMSNIYVVNNLPTLFGDVVPGLVRSKGNCKYITAEEIGEKPIPGTPLKDWPLDYGFRFTSERTDTKEILPYEYTVDDAKQADLWDKPTKSGYKSVWQKHPKRQLRNRCRTFCLRDLYPDALGGMYTYEEMREVTPEKEVLPELEEKMAVCMREAGLEPETASNTHDTIDTPDTTSEVEIVNPEATEPTTEGNEFDCSPGALESEQRQKETQTTMKLGGNDD